MSRTLTYRSIPTNVAVQPTPRGNVYLSAAPVTRVQPFSSELEDRSRTSRPSFLSTPRSQAGQVATRVQLSGGIHLIQSDGLILPKEAVSVPTILHHPHVNIATSRVTASDRAKPAPAASAGGSGSASAPLSAASTARRGSGTSPSVPSTPLSGPHISSRVLLAVEKEAVAAWSEQNLFNQDDAGARLARREGPRRSL